jgi:ribonucleoside-diphosphate reductase alpha chain
MVHRVASSIGDSHSRDEFHFVLSTGRFVPGGQIWRGAGAATSILYNCFVTSAESGESINDLAARVSAWTKRGCGVGVNVSKWVRAQHAAPEDALENVTTGVARSQEHLWTQGIRRTATMINIDWDIPGINRISRLLASSAEFRHINLGVMIRDSHIAAILDSINSSRPSADYEQLSELVSIIWSTGNPGIIFTDRVNERHLFNESIDACNPCAEQHLCPNEGCNLGSINLAAFVEGNQFKWSDYEATIRLGVKFLDKVVDATNFPTDEARIMSRRRRRIGLGIMGLDSALNAMGVQYDSTEALGFSTQLANTLNSVSHLESSALANQYGAFPDADLTNGQLRRNAYLNSIAPTGGISHLWSVSPGLEPSFEPAEIYPIEKKPWEISANAHIAVVERWQAHIDGGISKTVNIPENATERSILSVILNAWNMGFKGISLYRNMSRVFGER